MNYLGSPVQIGDNTHGSVRIDHQLSNAVRVMGRVNIGHLNLFEPYTEGTGVISDGAVRVGTDPISIAGEELLKGGVVAAPYRGHEALLRP